jgi:hypothetical protein
MKLTGFIYNGESTFTGVGDDAKRTINVSFKLRGTFIVKQLTGGIVTMNDSV